MAVGAGNAADEDAIVITRQWSEDREVADIQEMDIGIMPLPDAPWMRGKCGYKLIQYMACGLPVVASPVGVNRDIVDHGVNGFLAETPAEWAEALGTLVTDAALRQRMGAKARALVENQYSLRVQGPYIAKLLRSVWA
jgi:glycosyltransferase involved in cell wall biosynthesis